MTTIKALYILIAMFISIEAAWATIPAVPIAVNAELKDSIVTLRWQQPNNGGTPTGYKVYYDTDTHQNLMRDSMFTLVNSTSSKSMQFPLSFFQLGNPVHVFTVTAYNNDGESAKSEAEYCTFYYDYGFQEYSLITGDANSTFMYLSPEYTTSFLIDVDSAVSQVALPPIPLNVFLRTVTDIQFSIEYSDISGATINPNTGAVQTTIPSVPGFYTIVVNAAWQTMSYSFPLTFNIIQTPNIQFTENPPLVVQPNTMYQGYATAIHRKNPNAIFQYSLYDAPTGMTIDNASGFVSYNVPSNGENYFEFVVIATDQSGEQGYASFAVIIAEKRITANGGFAGSTGIGIPFEIHGAPVLVSGQDIGGSSDFDFTLLNAPEGMRLEQSDSSVTWSRKIIWTPQESGLKEFGVIVSGKNGVWGADTARFQIYVDDIYRISNQAPSFTDVQSTFEYTPIVKNQRDSIVNNLRYEPVYIATLNTELDVVDPNYFTNGTVDFDSTTGKVIWNPTNSGFLYVSARVFRGDAYVLDYVIKLYALDLSSIDTAAVTFATYPQTMVQPNQPWSYTPALQNQYLGRYVDAVFELDQAPNGMQIDSSKTITFTPTQEGIYDVMLRGTSVSDGKATMQPFMLISLQHTQPTVSNGTFLFVPYNWCEVGKNINQFNEVGLFNQYMVESLDSISVPYNVSDVRYAIESAPNGFSIDSITGAISWIPTEQGIYTVTVKAYHPQYGGIARVTMSYVAYAMPEKTMALLVKGMPKRTTSVEDFTSNKRSLQVYPMPATTYATIKLPHLQNTDRVTYNLCDMKGTVVLEGNESISNGTIQLSIDSLPQGSYVLFITANKEKLATPFIIQR